MLLAGLSTGNKIGLGVMAAVFICFALVSSFVIPRRRPDFPGRNGLSVFVIGCFALFAAMMTAVVVLGREKEAKATESKPSAPAASAKSVPVTEKEFKILLTVTSLPHGKVTFDVKNVGKIQHDLAVTGPKISGAARTPLIGSGKSAKLTVSLVPGSYTLYCTVPGHRKLGMVATLRVT